MRELNRNLGSAYLIPLCIRDRIAGTCCGRKRIFTLLVCHRLCLLACLQISHCDRRIRNGFSRIVVTQHAFQIGASVDKVCYSDYILRNRPCGDKTYRLRHIAIRRIILLHNLILKIRRQSLHNECFAICKLKALSALNHARAAIRLFIDVRSVRSLACKNNRVRKQLLLVVSFTFNRVADEQSALYDPYVRERNTFILALHNSGAVPFLRRRHVSVGCVVRLGNSILQLLRQIQNIQRISVLEPEAIARFDHTSASIRLLVCIAFVFARILEAYGIHKILRLIAAIAHNEIANGQLADDSFINKVRLVIAFILDRAGQFSRLRRGRITVNSRIIGFGYSIGQTSGQCRNRYGLLMLQGNLVTALDLAECIVRPLIDVFPVFAFASKGHCEFKMFKNIAAVAFNFIADSQLSLRGRRHNQWIIGGYFYAINPDGLPGRISDVYLINFCGRQPCCCINIRFLQLVIPRIRE